MEVDTEVRQRLWDAASQLSPRRAHDEDAVATTTLPFYEHVPPETALKRLYHWFHPTTTGDDKDGISREEFNKMRLATGRSTVSAEQWTAALRALGKENVVPEALFKELFGPPPFFGPVSKTHDLPIQLLMVQEIARMEEFVHFVHILYTKFATNGVVMTLADVHKMQRLAGMPKKTDLAVWEALCKTVGAASSAMHWMQFAQAWHANLGTKRETQNIFHPHKLPSDLVQALIATERVASHFGHEDVVSRKTLSSLLGVGKKKKVMTDKEWCDLLENMQTEEYPVHASTEHPQRRIKDVSVPLKPHDTIIHTANNLMMYEIAFDEPGSIGVGVQSDFLGQCLTIKSIGGQAAKHTLIQESDIIACINGTMTIFDPATSAGEEESRCSRIQAALDVHGSENQRVVFVRQEVYHRLAEDNLSVVLQTYASLPKDGSFNIFLPPGVRSRNNRPKITFEGSLQSDLMPTASYVPDTNVITVTFTGSKGLKSHSYIKLTLDEVEGPVLAGPGDITHVDGSTEVRLYSDWTHWKRLVTDAFATKPQGPKRFKDPSLTPRTLSVERGDHGLTFATDFYGQCAVVASVSPVKNITTVEPQDVLSCVCFTNADGVLERQSMIKPFALTPAEASRHFKWITSVLKTRVESQTPYTLQFLRLHSFYVQKELRTTFTFDALAPLSSGSVLTIEMPNTDWRAPDFDAIQAVFQKPDGLRVARMRWNAAAHVFEITLGDADIPSGTQLVLDLVGVKGLASRSAGPAEVTDVAPNALKFELHEHWHSFLGGWSGIATDQLVDVLTKLETTPQDLWTVLEYSHLLFEMFCNKTTGRMTRTEVNALRAAVYGKDADLSLDDWNTACRGMGAAPREGLDVKQFACALLSLLRGRVEAADLKRIYVYLHSVEKLFLSALDLFEPPSVFELHEDSMRALHKAAFGHVSWGKFLDKCRVHSPSGWSYDDFVRGFCMAHKKDGIDPVAGWVKLHYASLLFDQFARLNEMQRDHWRELLKARRSDVVLDEDSWEALCAVVVGDHITSANGLTKGGFVQAYHSKVLGARDAVVDWNFIQAYSVEPTAHHHRSEVLEAEMAIAPEKLSVNDIAAKALENLASTDDLAAEAIKEKVDFERTDVVEERQGKLLEKGLQTTFASSFATRDRGFLHVRVKCVSEMRSDDDDEDDDDEGALEQFYVVMYTITAAEWRDEFRPPTQSWSKRVRDNLAGSIKEWGLTLIRGKREVPYVVKDHEHWDEGKFQKIAATYAAMEAQFLQQPEVDDALRSEIQATCAYLNPYASCLTRPAAPAEPQPKPSGTRSQDEVSPAATVDLKARRAVSRLVNKDSSTAGVIRFPDDRFRLFLDQAPPEGAPPQTHVVIKLLKRTMRGDFDQKAFKRLVTRTNELHRAERSERVISALVAKQKLHVTHQIHAAHGIVNSEIQLELSKLKRKEKDLAALQADIERLRGDVHTLEALQAEGTAAAHGSTTDELVGHVALPLSDLLNILYEDSLETDDLVVLLDVNRHLACKVLLQFQYECQFVGRPTAMAPLPPIEDAIDYPSQAPLCVEWQTTDEVHVAKGDTLVLVREDELHNPILGVIYFLFFWKDDNGGFWDVFTSSLKLFSEPKTDKAEVVYTAPAADGSYARAGTLWLPSARDLSLPPGTYRLMLIRREEIDGKKFRTILDKSPALNVFVGVNSVHTVFGTTPFVDVKTVQCSMAVIDNANDRTIVSTLPATRMSETWLKASGYDIELANNIAMLRAQVAVLNDSIEANAGRPRVLEDLQTQGRECRERLEALETLKALGLEAIENQCASVSDVIKTRNEQLREWQDKVQRDTDAGLDVADDKKYIADLQSNLDELNETLSGLLLIASEYKRRRDAYEQTQAHATDGPQPFTYASSMRIQCLLEGDASIDPRDNKHLSDLSGDRILLIPQAVVDIADKLRVKILSKLQGMNTERTRHIRDQIQIELGIMLAIVEIYNAPWYCWLPNLRRQWRLYATLYDLDWLYIFEECYPEYEKASADVRRLFPFIIQELVVELSSRSGELSLPRIDTPPVAIAALREVPVTRFEPTSGDHPGMAGSVSAPVAHFVGLDPNWDSWRNYLRRLVGLDPCLGGTYIVKYVRRGTVNGSAHGAQGELGRAGPFTIEAEGDEPDWSFLPSAEKQLLWVETGFHFVIAALKYFVALLNLSFNVTFVSNLVAAADWFHVDTAVLTAMKADCKAAFASVLKFVSVIINWFNTFFASILAEIMINIDFFTKYQGCGHGYSLVLIWFLMWITTLILYIVIQEDVLVKVQKLSYYLPINVGRAGEDRLEQLGAILVSPVLISIKVLVLFIAKQWTSFSQQASAGTLFAYSSHSSTGAACPAPGVNYGFQIVFAVLLGIYFYFFLPLLVLDIYSWVPPTDLAKDEARFKASHGGTPGHIVASVKHNVNLVEPPPSWAATARRRNCHPFSAFWFAGRGKRLLREYKRCDFTKLALKYGYVGMVGVVVYLYSVLMVQAVTRALGAVVGWRGRATYMYDKPHLAPYGSSRMDWVCFRFNRHWKTSWLRYKVVEPCVSCILLTVGWWTTGQWTTYDIEERAKNCFPMEPSNEIKQLQMMALHGKINSLVWLPFPMIGILAYASDVLNRGPIFSYFLNRLFLQAGKAENERDPNVRWKFHARVPEVMCKPRPTVRCSAAGDDVVCLVPDTRFHATLLKWASSVLELAMVLLLITEPLQSSYKNDASSLKVKAIVALVSAAVAPVLELNDQVLKSYRKYQEFKGSVQNAIDAAKASATQQAQSAVLAQADRFGKAIGEQSFVHEQVNDYLNPTDTEEETKTEDDDSAKDLVVLSATPEMSYVIQGDRLDEGEGLITVNWRVNASRRFHAFDAIGMFPARKLEDALAKRTMDECLCFRLVAELGVQPFGWHPTSNEHGNAISSGVHAAKMLKHAVFLDKVTSTKINDLARKSIAPKPVADVTSDEAPPTLDLKQASFVLEKELNSTKLEPYGKEMHDIFIDEMHEQTTTATAARARRSRAIRGFGAPTSRALIVLRVSGQVKFRPANSSEHEDHPLHENYVFGNGVGIYPCKYGLESYEFYYLKYTGNHLAKDADPTALYQVVVPSAASSASRTWLPRNLAPPPRKAKAVEPARADYEPLAKFTSNKIAIGTFDLFIRLTSDAPSVWANEAVNLSWEIYGVDYKVLSHPSNKNCIAFYKVRDIHDTRLCTKIEIVPPSAFLQTHGSGGPVSGRMLVRTPAEPGMYEIRFLFNYFHEAKLHRRCQAFGQLEESMQLERVKYLFQRRDLTRSLGLLQHANAGVWAHALVYAYSWLHPILGHLLYKHVAADVANNPSLFNRAMVTALGAQCHALTLLDHPQLQACLARLLAPLMSPQFLMFFANAFNGSEEMKAHTAALELVSPDDITCEAFLAAKKRSMQRWPAPDTTTVADSTWLLHSDQTLLDVGPENFELLANEYLGRSLLPGRLDILDELLLDNHLLLTGAKLVVESVTTASCSLYEPAIANAVQSFLKKSKQEGKFGLFQDLTVALQDECRNHLQKLVRAVFETHTLTGDRFVGWDDDARYDPNAPVQLGVDVPQQQALRAWAKPRLVANIVKTLKRRYADLTSTNVAVAQQMCRAAGHTLCCKRIALPSEGSDVVNLPLPTGKSHRVWLLMSFAVAKSVVYFYNQAIADAKAHEAAA
ncbi:hypothetical protein ACHHYP_15043 [Achlya hypogyna]|uniref:Uncharacterized protein n=1 Tax=Achlya hypogyna TaxID=1202772 RepID=A0A1V9YBM3_ACHHY|nr:hypothetical protein ACHHYP_15043 [Achlya hypogyna]